jgi:dehydratase
VTAGATFQVTLAPDPMTVPPEAGGYAVDKLTKLALKVPVPQGSTYQSATLTGGSGLGNGTPTVTQSGGVVTIGIPGPIAGGATFQLPALHLTLTASGAAGTTVESKVSGASYDDPGLTFIATVKVGIFPIDVPTSCFPNPSPVLTSTAIA